MRPTPENFDAHQKVFDFFNEKLFDGKLPQVLITMQSRGNFLGMFTASVYTDQSGAIAHELSMNPFHLGKSAKDYCSTFVHEMVHELQRETGKPGRAGYHNKQWGKLMKEIGLYPSETGQPGGKEIGDKMSHYIVEGGPFEKAFDELEKTGFQFPWGPRKVLIEAAIPESTEGNPGPSGGRPSKSTRMKWQCECGEAIWGKQELSIRCKLCDTDFIIVGK